jgi:hypothetical protein
MVFGSFFPCSDQKHGAKVLKSAGSPWLLLTITLSSLVVCKRVKQVQETPDRLSC